MKNFLTALILIIAFQNGFSQTTSLNGTWSFRIDPNNKGESQRWFNPAFSTLNWDDMPVPYNWDLKNEYAHYVGKAWYRRSFELNGGQKNKVFRLIFEGVYNDSKVWLNGVLLGQNNIGFLPFEFEVSQLLNHSGKNTLVVLADNTFKRGAIWNWGGIRRDVKLEATNKTRIVRQQITPTVDLENKTAAVTIKVFLQNHDSKPSECAGNVAIKTNNGQIKQLPFATKIQANGTQQIEVKANFSPSETHLWGLDDPFLYTVEAKIHGTNETEQSRFGLRKIELDNTKFELRLNGEPVRLMGMNLVPDDRTTGNTLPLWRFKEDIDLLKSLGCNMARLTHLPLPKESLDYLDEVGFLIFDEVPLWGYDELADPANPVAFEWLNRLIHSDYNHPSIIGWSVANEIGRYPTAQPYVEKANVYVKKLDSTRLAVAVSHTANDDKDIIDFSDMGLINKYQKNLKQVTELQHKKHPNKTLFYTEFGLGQIGEDLNTDFDAKAAIDSMRFIPYLIGASYWTFNDYRSNYNGTKELSENRSWGIVDVARQKKKAYYSFKKEQIPVKQFQVTSDGQLTIEPRKKLDLPAYTLKNYKIVYQFKDAKSNTLSAGFVTVPTLKPDDPIYEHKLNWIKPENAHSVAVVFLSPLNFSTADTTIYFQKPTPTGIIATHGVRQLTNSVLPKTGAMRIVFEKNKTAKLHKIKYGINEMTFETKPTLNFSENIKDLAFGVTYQVSVVSINEAGETDAEIQHVKIGMDALPPTIRYTEAAPNGFFVGYSVQPLDKYYRIQYTTLKGQYSEAPIIQTDAKGTLFVGDLENGKPYYFRMQTIADPSSYSAWSEEKMIVPDGGILPHNPNIQYVIQNNDEALICFEPLKKSIGYVLAFRSKSNLTTKGKEEDWQNIDISSAQIAHFQFKKPKSKFDYEFRIAAKNTYGISKFSEVK